MGCAHAGGGLRRPAAGHAHGAVRGGRVRAAGPDALRAPPAGAHHLRLLHPLLPGVRACAPAHYATESLCACLHVIFYPVLSSVLCICYSQKRIACRLLFSYEVLTPAALNFFVSYADGAVESLWSIDQYFEFVLVLMLSTGLSFQACIGTTILFTLHCFSRGNK